jgi:hypothetical protein
MPFQQAEHLLGSDAILRQRLLGEPSGVVASFVLEVLVHVVEEELEAVVREWKRGTGPRHARISPTL